MMNTLPSALSADLLSFCATISPATPAFVPSLPSSDARPSQCFDNVIRKIASEGGDVVNGWAIWHFRGAYFEAEHHGVWRSPSGELQDVSPQPFGASRLLFLEDDTATYDPSAFRSNIMAAQPGTPFGARIVDLARRRHQVIDSYRAPGVVVANISSLHQSEIAAIDVHLALLMSVAAASADRG